MFLGGNAVLKSEVEAMAFMKAGFNPCFIGMRS